MTPEKTARLGWIVALIMLSVALILGARLISVSNNVNFGDVRDDIHAACTSSVPERQAKCASSLKQLYALLEDIQKERLQQEAVVTSDVEVTPVATTTPGL